MRVVRVAESSREAIGALAARAVSDRVRDDRSGLHVEVVEALLAGGLREVDDRDVPLVLEMREVRVEHRDGVEEEVVGNDSRRIQVRVTGEHALLVREREARRHEPAGLRLAERVLTCFAAACGQARGAEREEEQAANQCRRHVRLSSSNCAAPPVEARPTLLTPVHSAPTSPFSSRWTRGPRSLAPPR